MCNFCSKLIIKTQDTRLENNVNDVILVSSLLTFNRFYIFLFVCFCFSIVNVEQVNDSCVIELVTLLHYHKKKETKKKYDNDNGKKYIHLKCTDTKQKVNL